MIVVGALAGTVLLLRAGRLDVRGSRWYKTLAYSSSVITLLLVHNLVKATPMQVFYCTSCMTAALYFVQGLFCYTPCTALVR